MSSHRRNGSRELVSRPLLAGILAVMLLVASVAAWRGLGDRIDDDSSASAGTCLDGEAVVPVIADPGVAPALTQIADDYNALHPVVRDRCISVQVRPADAVTVLEGLTADDWDQQAYGAFPGAWVPESSIWTAALQTARPEVLSGDPQSLVTSPVLLAMEPQIASAGGDGVAWSELPSLTRANALAVYGRSSWGSMRIAMPQGAQSDATALAGQAVAAATADTDQPLTERQASSGAVTAALDELMSAPPRIGDGSAEAAVRSIIDTDDPGDTPVRAVPITEQRLYLLTRDDRRARVAAVRPEGATPLADYPVISLSSAQSRAYLADATSEFFTFARKPEQLKLLTASGFRGAGPLPEPTATVRFDEVRDPMPIPQPAAATTINAVVLPAATP